MLLHLLITTALAQTQVMLADNQRCELSPNWSHEMPSRRRRSASTHYISGDSQNMVFWDGEPVDALGLVAHLNRAAEAHPQPVIVINLRQIPDCEWFERVRVFLERSAFDCSPVTCLAGFLPSSLPYQGIAPPPPPPPPAPSARRPRP